MPAANCRIALRSSSPPTTTAKITQLVRSTGVRAEAADRVVREGVELAAVRAGRFGLPEDVRRDAGADDRGAVALARPGRPRAVAEEPVAKGPTSAVHEKAVLALPAAPVGRVEGVDVQVSAEAVERYACGGGTEPVHRACEIREAAEDVVEAAVGPVGGDLEHGGRARPVRQAKLPDRLLGARPEAVVREHPLPALQRPVRAVRRTTRCKEPVQLGAVVGAAGVPERLPDRAPEGAPAARVVELELDLKIGRASCRERG